MPSLASLTPDDTFIHRHIGPSDAEIHAMLAELGLENLEDLIATTLPQDIRDDTPLALSGPQSERKVRERLLELAEQNQLWRSFIGLGYANTLTPRAIVRNILENPGWYTAYTPYQAEISQGRLEALLNFQQVIMDFTGMEVANASLLDEATAAAEAMTMLKRVNKKSKSKRYFIASDVHPQTLDVLRTRAEYFGFELVIGDPETELDLHDVFGVQLQYPGSTGQLKDLRPIIEQAHQQKALVSVAADLLSLALLTPPGEMGADVVVGSSQRFGVPLGFGGPHAAFYATRDSYKRQMPGRIIGVSQDSRGQMALRMALQTREQHIRRDKATSNICTAQALLAVVAGMYAVYHGPDGIRRIAGRVHRLAQVFAAGLEERGLKVRYPEIFDTVSLEADAEQVRARAEVQKINVRYGKDGLISVTLDETTREEDVADLWTVFLGEGHGLEVAALDETLPEHALPASLVRTSTYLDHEVFHKYHSESELMRYLKRLENKDYSLTNGMIPLGSCTMKLNAAVELEPITWSGFADIHPFAPKEQTHGYQTLIEELERDLATITGYDAVSMQPNSGAQGEYTGLLAIRKYHEAHGQGERNVCLIPSSAHGTNPASAMMMGLEVVVVECDAHGNIDVADLKAKADRHSSHLAALMLTYPSTHGVFEACVREVIDCIHAHGGQVYLDGANLNAQIGLTSPGFLGSDVSHLNLHKTFCIPHGGGGPGMGPIGVKAHLAPYLPNHSVRPVSESQTGAVSAAPYGSASILPITYAYIKLMGAKGLKKASEIAILNANYIAEKLRPYYSILYTGQAGRVAHECILDIRPLKERMHVTEEDIAKRLMDYGFHAPTMSFPVAGTLMIEPTESENKAELDRFIEAMVSIRQEVAVLEESNLAVEDSALRHAPHTLSDLCDLEWDRPYSREHAVMPAGMTTSKVWPTVNRIDNVYGDRHVVCSCPPTAAYAATPSPQT